MTQLEKRLQEISKSNTKFYNWSRTFGCAPELYFEPECEEDVIKIVELAKTNNKNVRAIGSGHSPSDLACTNGYMIDMNKLNRILKVDLESKTVVVEAGIKLHELNEELSKHGMALSSLGSISDQSISGAISTGTHGSGINFRNLCDQITSLTLITASKGVIHCSTEENPDVYKATLCSLGALGIITRVSIKCENAFRLESMQTPEKLTKILDNLDEIIHSAEHVRFWWFPHTDDCVVWKANRTSKDLKSLKPSYIRNTVLGFHAFQFFLYLSRFVTSANPLITRAMFNLNFSKPIHVIDTSYKVFNFDCLFPQYVNEWSIPLERTEVAMRRLYTWVNESGLSVHFPVEVRFVDQDDIWLSPAYGRRVCYIGIIMYRPYGQSVPYKKYWTAYEEIMKSCGGRPHWAKVHNMSSSELSKSYPKFDSFVNIQKQLDPSGIFLNSYLKRHLLGLEDENHSIGRFNARL